MQKIVITTTSFAEYDEEPLNILRRGGLEPVVNPFKRKLDKSEILKLCDSAAGIIAGTEAIDAEVISRLGALKVISRCGAGLENVDMAAAERSGIKVFNTPDAPTEAVSELTIALMLDMLRRVSFMDRAMRGGIWEKNMGNLISRKSVGIIGFGRIGRRVAKLLKPFGCTLFYYDPFVDIDSAGVKKTDLDTLLSKSDIVSIHASVKERIIGDREIGLMKKGAWIINVSRGEAVDEKAIYQALKSGRLAGGAFDVFQKEPYTGKLAELDNVILTPHIGSYAREARINMEKEAALNLIKGLGMLHKKARSS